MKKFIRNLLLEESSFKAGVPNLSFAMYPFSILTDEHVPLKSLMTKRLSTITKFTEFLMERLYFWNYKFINKHIMIFENNIH